MPTQPVVDNLPVKWQIAEYLLVCPEGIEPPTLSLEG